MSDPQTHSQPAGHECFAGNGEMAARMQSFDWSKTPLGPVERWPQSLKTTVRIMLTSRYAMWMAWGPELTFFYNDAYTPTLGIKHDRALGSSASKLWAEIWPDIGPRIERVLQTGEATWDEGLRLFLERSGYPEETYHTFSYSPLADDMGVVSGMLCVVTEETERVIGERRLKTLRDLGARTTLAKTVDEACRFVVTALGENTADVPFSLLYLTDRDGKTARALRVEPSPGRIGCEPRDHRSDGYALRLVMAASPVGGPRTGRVHVVDVRRRFGELPGGPGSPRRPEAIVLPLRAGEPGTNLGVPGRGQSAHAARLTTRTAASSSLSPARPRRPSRTPAPTRRNGSGPRHWPSSTGPRPPSSPTSAMSSARR